VDARRRVDHRSITVLWLLWSRRAQRRSGRPPTDRARPDRQGRREREVARARRWRPSI